MEVVKFSIPGMDDFLSVDQRGAYMAGWKQWCGDHQRLERRTLAQCARTDQVVIKEVYCYEAPATMQPDPGRGEIVVGRAAVDNKALRKNVNPYNFGKEKQYIYPFWHETHFWQSAEQLGHALRNLWHQQHKEINYELILTPRTCFDISNHVYFHEPAAVELIWQRRRGLERKGVKMRLENFFFSFYCGDSKVATMTSTGYTRLREWRALAEKITRGDIPSRAALCEKLRRQRQTLEKVGRKPPHLTQALIAEVEAGVINPSKLENFFSLWEPDDASEQSAA